MCYCREVGRSGDMSYISIQPSNSLSERFVLGGRLSLRNQDGLNEMADFFHQDDGVLRKYTSYQISVTPYNKQGIGPASSSVVATTMEDGKELFISNPILYLQGFYLLCFKRMNL